PSYPLGRSCPVAGPLLHHPLRMALLSAFLLTLTSRSSVRLKRCRYRTTEAPPRPSGRRGRISERPQRPELTTLALQSRPNASPFWIMLLLSVGALEHRMIKQIAAPLQSTRLRIWGSGVRISS